MERMIRRRGVRFVVGPDGYPLTVDDLPATPPRRWMIRRKAQVVTAVAGGLLTIEQACDRFLLTRDEFLTWKASVARYGRACSRSVIAPQSKGESGTLARSPSEHAVLCVLSGALGAGQHGLLEEAVPTG